MHEDILKVLLTEQQISERVKTIGAEITRDYKGRVPVIISVLKGSFIFMADLVRAIDNPLEVDFMVVSSYNSSTETSGQVQILKDVSLNLEGRDVIIVEDILDSGLTLSYIAELFEARNIASLRIATLLDKPLRRRVPVKADYVGFDVPDEFVVGYGLDYDQRYRNLPYIGVLKPEVYSK